MGAFILSFCCVDYMGAAYNPRKKNTRVEFKRFVKEYMGSINNRYQVLSNEIYAIRNSLIHSYGRSVATDEINLQPTFSHLYSDLHLKTFKQEDQSIIIVLNLPEFVGELVAAIEKYFRENIGLNENSVIWQLKLFSVQNQETIKNRESMLTSNIPRHALSHRFFSILEQDPPAELSIIKKSIQDSILKQYGL
ncbi:MAG: hypothetical protein QM764_00680 [Chitinophagaceae bacterium]